MDVAVEDPNEIDVGSTAGIVGSRNGVTVSCRL